jgi:hypothetical protein
MANDKELLEKVFDFKSADPELMEIMLWNMKNLPEFKLMVAEIALDLPVGKIPIENGVEMSVDISVIPIKLLYESKEVFMYLGSDDQFHIGSINEGIAHEVSHIHHLVCKVYKENPQLVANYKKFYDSSKVSDANLMLQANISELRRTEKEDRAITLGGDKSTAAIIGEDATRENYLATASNLFKTENFDFKAILKQNNPKLFDDDGKLKIPRFTGDMTLENAHTIQKDYSFPKNLFASDYQGLKPYNQVFGEEKNTGTMLLNSDEMEKDWENAVKNPTYKNVSIKEERIVQLVERDLISEFEKDGILDKDDIIKIKEIAAELREAFNASESFDKLEDKLYNKYVKNNSDIKRDYDAFSK